MTEPTLGAVAALSRDVFFGMRIRTVLAQLGYEMRLCKNEQELVEAVPGAVIARSIGTRWHPFWEVKCLFWRSDPTPMSRDSARPNRLALRAWSRMASSAVNCLHF